MKLTEEFHPKIPLHTARALGKLYNEMDLTIRQHKQFNQDDCDTCVIGYGLKTGILVADEGDFDPDADSTEFGNAITNLNLPKTPECLKSGSDGDYEDYEMQGSIWSGYLFGGTECIHNAAAKLKLPRNAFTAAHAKIRIAAVLRRAGYELKDDLRCK